MENVSVLRTYPIYRMEGVYRVEMEVSLIRPVKVVTYALTPSTTTPPLKGASVLPPLPTSSTADASPVPPIKSTTAPSNSASTAQVPSHSSRTASAWPAQSTPAMTPPQSSACPAQATSSSMLPTGAPAPVVFLTTTAPSAFLAAQALSGTPPANPATRALTPSTTTRPLKGASVLHLLPIFKTTDVLRALTIKPLILLLVNANIAQAALLSSPMVNVLLAQATHTMMLPLKNACRALVTSSLTSTHFNVLAQVHYLITMDPLVFPAALVQHGTLPH